MVNYNHSLYLGGQSGAMSELQPEGTSYGAQFMLREYEQIVGAYHDLHVQKNELIKFYLAFVSLPLSIVALVLSLFKYLQPSVQSQNLIEALRTAAVYLSILLVFVGISVLMSMLRIRGEQYLYVKTINAVRMYFRDQYKIEEKYLVLPSTAGEITFAHEELTGRAFWEAMIVSATTSLLLVFLAGEIASRLSCLSNHVWSVCTTTFVFVAAGHVVFVRWWLDAKLKELGLRDRES